MFVFDKGVNFALWVTESTFLVHEVYRKIKGFILRRATTWNYKYFAMFLIILNPNQFSDRSLAQMLLLRLSCTGTNTVLAATLRWNKHVVRARFEEVKWRCEDRNGYIDEGSGRCQMMDPERCFVWCNSYFCVSGVSLNAEHCSWTTGGVFSASCMIVSCPFVSVPCVRLF